MDKKIISFSILFLLFLTPILAQNISFLKEYENDTIYISLFEKNQKLDLNLTNEQLLEARTQIEKNQKNFKFTILLYLFILIVIIILFIAFLKIISKNEKNQKKLLEEKINQRKKKDKLDYSFLKYRENKKKNN